MFLEGRDKKPGCTILLRGGPKKELLRVKRIIRTLLLMERNANLEKAYFLAIHAAPSEKHIPILGVKLNEITLSPFIRLEVENETEESTEDSESGSNEKQAKDDKENENKSDEPANRDFEFENHQLLSMNLTVGMENSSVRNLLSDFRAKIGTQKILVDDFSNNDLVNDDSKEEKDFKSVDHKPFPLLFASYSPTSRYSTLNSISYLIRYLGIIILLKFIS